MKVLLLHPADRADSGPWRDLRWDRVVDLGSAGDGTYARWSQSLSRPVESSLHRGINALHRVRELLAAGCGRLFDNYGLDWWEILSILLVEQLESIIVLERLAETMPADEISISRPGTYAAVLQTLLNGRLQIFPRQPNHRFSKVAHYADVAAKLSLSQILDVLCDKYDPGQQLRAMLSHARPRSWRALQRSEHPLVLLPTAYVNVTRTAVAYANTLPQQNFLLVSTRRSGWLKTLPENVAAAWLSSYADVRDRRAELAAMEIRWQSLLKDLLNIQEFKMLEALACFHRFPQQLRHGFEIRDAWRNVLDREPVQAVLCADDINPYTRIPLLLARQRGLPNLACHHGALNGYYAAKRTFADVILAKGKMEKDYLVQRCGVPANHVEIGAPLPATKTTLPAARPAKQPLQWTRDAFRSRILFISEAYEASNARAEEFYRDVLPPLADLAINTGRKLIVKLHPAESRRERCAMVKKVLSAQQMAVTQVIDGPLTDALLDVTWFGVTVLSTVAVECAVRGIPCFLCQWLEYSFYGYIEQFIRFGAGIGLTDPGEIRKIPQHLQKYEPDPVVAANCWQPIRAERWLSLIVSSSNACAAAAS